MKIFKLTTIKFISVLFLFIFLLILKANVALAATVYLTPDFDSVAVGDTVIVSAKLDPMDKNPNVVEGNISIESGAEKIKILKLITAGSVLTFWPQYPSLSEESLISFNGGTPGGFDQQGSILFKIAFLAEEEGELVFLPTNFKVYDNDGKASLVEVALNPLTITIEPKGERPVRDQWLELTTKDQAPPRDLTITLGQDNNLFNGKKFITIYALDDESGIDHYEVTEGARPTIRSGDTYVFQDQSLKSLITVKAVDRAGNASVAKYEPQIAQVPVEQEVQPKSYTALILVFLILGLIIVAIILVIIKIKNKNVPKRKNVSKFKKNSIK